MKYNPMMIVKPIIERNKNINKFTAKSSIFVVLISLTLYFMRKAYLYILLFTGTFISACKNNPHYYIVDNNDTIAMYVYNDKEYNEKWNVILSDSIKSQKELHDIFVKSGLFNKLKNEANNSDQRFSKEFFIYHKKNTPSFESCDHSNFYMQGFLIAPSAILEETQYRYLLNTQEEYMSTQREISNEISKQIEKITNATIQEKKPYYGKSLFPVTEYLKKNLGKYTPLYSSEIIKKGDFYTVRHIYNTENTLGATIKCDKIFTINGQGEIVNITDYKE